MELKHFQCAGLVLIAAFLLSGNAPAAAAKQQLFEAYKSLIVLDPGHGGDEIGARGPEGTLEKGVTLQLANILAAQLQPNYRTVLSRTDDYEMSLDNRTATANTLKADLFISIHTGGSSVHSTSGATIYHYQSFSEETRSRTAELSQPAESTDAPILWNQVQNHYIEKSRILAGLINAQLSSTGTVKESRVAGAPLAVLEGANMPAILIEVGYLTNPAEEKNLRDEQFLTDLAQAIRRGIDEYFEKEN
ncbi:MAG: N-acetylmuramoyl-L-alanine amidase [Desulfobacterales bacterium]